MFQIEQKGIQKLHFSEPLITLFFLSSPPAFLSPNLNDIGGLESLGYEPDDLWTPAIRGQMRESFPCYTYQPKNQRTNGIFNHVSKHNLLSRESCKYG